MVFFHRLEIDSSALFDLSIIDVLLKSYLALEQCILSFDFKHAAIDVIVEGFLFHSALQSALSVLYESREG